MPVSEGPCPHSGMSALPLPVSPDSLPAGPCFWAQPQAGTTSRTFGIYTSYLYFTSRDNRLWFPLFLPFTAIWLGRSCPAQPSILLPLWEVRKRGFNDPEREEGHGILPQVIQMFQSAFTKMAIGMREKKQEDFVSDSWVSSISWPSVLLYCKCIPTWVSLSGTGDTVGWSQERRFILGGERSSISENSVQFYGLCECQRSP